SPLLIEGRLKLDTWEKDGKKNSKLRVVGERMQLLGSRGGDAPRGEGGRPKGKTADNRGPAPQADEFDQSGGYDAAVSGSIESSGTVGSDDDIPF
ncbi:MAG: single-stranded DNA-binding protein, partial [Planctomycetota bacterium]